MLGDAVIDPSSGWASLVLQGGAFGLLTYVVTVLAPKALVDAKAERESRDQRFAGALDNLNIKFEERNKEIVGAIREQTMAMTTAMKEVCRHG